VLGGACNGNEQEIQKKIPAVAGNPARMENNRRARRGGAESGRKGYVITTT
jgi:hypothetical protein